MNLQIDYLKNHRYAIPKLAELHHAEWLSVSPTLSVADRIAGFEARARRGSIPTGFVAIDEDVVVGMACLVECDRGFAFNVTTDVNFFNLIVPCGIADKGVTSLSALLGRRPEITEVEDRLVAQFAAVFERAVLRETINTAQSIG